MVVGMTGLQLSLAKTKNLQAIYMYSGNYLESWL